MFMTIAAARSHSIGLNSADSMVICKDVQLFPFFYLHFFTLNTKVAFNQQLTKMVAWLSCFS